MGIKDYSSDADSNVKIDGVQVDMGEYGWQIPFAIRAIMADLGDFYEEGTFTPEVADAASGGNTAAGTFRGHYQKIGNRVTIDISLENINSTGLTLANLIYIRNLPYTAANLPGTVFFTAATLTNSVTFTGTLLARMRDSQDYILLFDARSVGGAPAIDFNAITSGISYIYFTMSYQI